jgi:SNF2 family DNA or RNA helicase
MNHNDLLSAFKQRGCFPHQAEFAAKFFAPDSKRKHLLVSAPGFGKGFAAGVIVNYALSSGQANRILVLSPSALLVQWCDTIQQGAPSVPPLIVDRHRLRELEDSRPVGEDFWPANVVVIMSIDLAKREDVAGILARSSWDCLVVDEVQLVTPQNRRGRVVADLLTRSPKMRVLYLRVGGLLAGSEIDTSSDLFRDAAITAWSRETVRDHNGKPLLPEVRIEWISHHRQPDETAVLVRLQESLRSVRESGDTQLRFLAVNLLQSASSSLFALEQRLRRLRQRRNEIVHGIIALSEAELDPESDEAEQHLSQECDDQARLQLELAEIATPILQMLEEVTSDSKCEALLHTLNSLGIKDSTDRRVCVFTRFVDTADYLESALRDSYSQVGVLTGRLEFAERERIIADFARHGGVLIATESIATAVPEVAAVVFYDLPLNPAVLEARIGQFVRVGRHGPIRVFAFADESHALVIERLQNKIAEIKEAIGEDEIDSLLFSKVQP